MAEADLAPAVTRYLRDFGCRVHHEVVAMGARADAVGLRETPNGATLVHVVEMKTALSLAVLDQAIAWCRRAHFVTVAVPSGKRRWYGTAVLHMCKEFGIGIIEVDADRFEWHDRARTAFRRVVDADRVIAACVPENEAESGSLVAGSRGGGYSTPFSRTVERISRFVAAREKLTDQPVLVRDALTMVEHHYSSLSSARSALVALAHARKILPLRVVQRGRDMYFTTQPEERTNGN